MTGWMAAGVGSRRNHIRWWYLCGYGIVTPLPRGFIIEEVGRGAALGEEQYLFRCVNLEVQSNEKSSKWLEIPLNYKSN